MTMQHMALGALLTRPAGITFRDQDGPAPATRRSDTPAFPGLTRRGRLLRRLRQAAAVGALTLTLAGTMAGSAEARPWYVAMGVAVSNERFCIGMGGDPYTLVTSGSYITTCYWSDGSMEYYDAYYD